MKISSLLAASAVLALTAGLPAEAQRGVRISCFRNRNVITCPGYGQFNIRNNNRWDDDDHPDFSDRYDDVSGLRAINEIYLSVLGRRTDLSGARTYIRNLNSGWSLQRVRRDVAFSLEAENLINQAYRQILGRNADPDGLETYKNYLANGRSINDVRRKLANSEEALRFGRRF